jgi:hypothetical protein
VPLPNTCSATLHTLISMMLDKNQSRRASIDDILSVPEVTKIVY